jgi:hypothetical protein
LILAITGSAAGACASARPEATTIARPAAIATGRRREARVEDDDAPDRTEAGELDVEIIW